MKDTPVLVLKFREFDDDRLEQRMDDDYIRAFVPGMLDLNRQYGFNNAYIIPIEGLMDDQIVLLKSRGAFVGKAEIEKEEYAVRIGDLTSRMNHPLRRASLFDYVCIFQRTVENHRVWLEAYTVSQHAPMGFTHSMFGMRYGFGLSGSSYLVSPTVS